MVVVSESVSVDEIARTTGTVVVTAVVISE
jgi:hypothetical protein